MATKEDAINWLVEHPDEWKGRPTGDEEAEKTYLVGVVRKLATAGVLPEEGGGLNELLSEARRRLTVSGEFSFSREGGLSFTCHNVNADFELTRLALLAVRDHAEQQLRDEAKCPFAARPAVTSE